MSQVVSLKVAKLEKKKVLNKNRSIVALTNKKDTKAENK